MSSSQHKHVQVTAARLALPVVLSLAVAFIYVLPPLYAKQKFPAPPGKVYSQYALRQLYNYDEYGMYLPGALSIVSRHVPYAESFTYEGREDKAVVPYFAPLYIIALFQSVAGGEMSMALIDACFAIIGFLCIYFLFLRIVPSHSGACIAALLTMLPLPALRVFELAGIYPSGMLARTLFYTGELPMMSRTYSPQMTVPLMALFLIGCAGMRQSRPSRSIKIITGVTLGLGFYFSIFCGAILAVTGVKIFALDVLAHKRRLRAYAESAAVAMVVMLPCVYFYHHFNTRLSAGDMDKYLLSEDFARLSLQSAAAVLFFAGAYAVYFVDRLKTPALALSLAAMPFSVYFAVHGGPIGSNFYYFTPGIYLMMAAALPRSGTGALVFLLMSSCVEPAFVMRIITGKTHADVHYFYRSYFLQFVPLLVVSWAWLSIVKNVKPTRALAAAALAAMSLFILLCGTYTAVTFASDNRNNYFISRDMVDGAEWLSTNTKPGSVVLSMDPGTNIYLFLTTGRYLFLPRAGMSPFSMSDQQSRLADALKLLSASPQKIDWRAWESFGYYMFELYSTRPECAGEVAKMTPLSKMPAHTPFRLDYLWFGPEEKKIAGVSPDTVPELKKVYEKGGVKIYRYTGLTELPAN